MREWLYYKFWIGIYDVILISFMIIIALAAMIFGKLVSGNGVGNLILFLVAMIATVIYLLYKDKVKGKAGEYITERMIVAYCKENCFLHVYDLMIPNSKTGYSQIDHLIITDKGIAAIETKFHKGKIYGSEMDEKWTYVFYTKGKKKCKELRENPVRQNYGHIEALKETLNGYDVDYFNIVSFVDTADLKKWKPVNPFTSVIYTYELKAFIDDFRGMSQRVINKEDMENIYQLLLSKNMTDKETRKKHIKNLREKLGAQSMDRRIVRPKNVEAPKIIEKRDETEPSYITSAKLYVKYKDERVVAKERGLTPMTVQGHIVQAYEERFDFGDLQLVTEGHAELIKAAIEKVGKAGLKAIKGELPNDVGYLEIKIVMSEAIGLEDQYENTDN